MSRPSLALLCAIAVPAFVDAPRADDSPPPLVTDRPDQTESPSVVPRGLVQIETGWAHVVDSEEVGDLRTDGWLETLARVGVGGRFELRLEFDGFRVQDERASDGQSEHDDGFGAASLGFKVGLVEERGARPQIALIAGAVLPVGHAPFASDGFDPFLRATASHGLGEGLSLSYNLGAAWLTQEDEAGDEDTLSVLLGTVSLGVGATERLGFFFELFGESGLSAEDDFSAADAGLTWLVRDNVQLDLSGGVGLSSSADDWFAGLGVSFRLPR